TRAAPERLSPLSTGLERILQSARELAQEMAGDSTVAGDHLMVALLRSEEALLRQLEAFGLDKARFEDIVKSSCFPALRLEETLRDVGTTLATAQEEHRASLAHVVQANLKRLQEALRALEEYGKVYSAGLGKALESLRYSAYTLERSLVNVAGARERLHGARLYLLLTGCQCAASLDWTIQEAAAGGVRIFQ